MNIKLGEIISAIEKVAPLNLQESYDNAGLITGDYSWNITGALMTLDCTEEIVDEAISLGYNLIIAHHPIIFKGLKQINGKNYVERTIIKAIKNDIAIYACHTNLDNILSGVNKVIADRVGLRDTKILAPMPQQLQQMYFYVPSSAASEVKAAIFQAGGGQIGNYSECSFSTQGIGTFRPNSSANPKIGQAGGSQESVEEMKIEFLVPAYLSNSVLKAVNQLDYYEEKPYGIIPLTNAHQELGAGLIGDLDQEMTPEDFLKWIKNQFQAEVIKYTPFQGKISKVAVCGGAGSFLLHKAKSSGAQAFITSDFKYHEFFDAEGQIMILDIGHFESEQYTYSLFQEILSEKFPTFAVRVSERNTNPVRYYY